MLGRSTESLFGEDERGDASQGGPQGNPLMGAAFCLAIHPYVKRLHERLAEAGGEAKADMDDCYATGPANVVFEAVEECLLGLSEIGLVARVEKFEVYSPLTDVTDNPIRKRLGIPLRDPNLPQGLPCGGVPLGSAAYEAAEAGKIATEVVREIDRVTSAFKGSPHHLWKATTLSSLSRFDYWLQHLAPEHTSEAAKLVDAAIDRAVLACLQGTRVAEDMLIKKRLALPTRMGGWGLRSRESMRYAAYAGSLISSIPQFATRRARDGTERAGFFPSLGPSLGGGGHSHRRGNC